QPTKSRTTRWVACGRLIMRSPARLRRRRTWLAAGSGAIYRRKPPSGACQSAICPERGARAYRALLRQAADVEDSIVAFRQGSILGIETDFTPGAFALARALRRPILPVALTGSH